MDLTGMFRITEFIENQEMILERNDSYWGTVPKTRRIRILFITDPQTRVLTAQDGKTHIVTHIPPEGVTAMKDRKNINLIVSPAPGTTSVYINLRSEIFQDVRVRQALNWGVDRQELVNLTREGLSPPASSWLATNPLYPETTEQGYTHYDPNLADKLLHEAGWVMDRDGVRKKDGHSLTFRLLTWELEKTVGEVLQNQWKKIGAIVDVQSSKDIGMLLAKREEGDWDMMTDTWSTFGDPLALLSTHFKPGGDLNIGGYDDLVTNQLLNQMSKTFDNTERRKLLLQINRRICEMAPIIPLHPRPLITAVSTKVEGFQQHFDQFQFIINADLSVKK
jgi:peptide/nickel transport system substrate-binding protein